MLEKDGILCCDVEACNNGGDNECRTEVMNDKVQM